MDVSGVFPVRPAIGSPARPPETTSVRVALEDEILASWLDVLVADGLVPPRSAIGYPY